MNNTFRLYATKTPIVGDDIKIIIGEITIKQDSGSSINRDVYYVLSSEDEDFDELKFNDATSEITLSQNQMKEIYAAEYAYYLYQKLDLPTLEGISEEEVLFAQTVRSRIVHCLLESFYEDKNGFETDGFCEADYIRALNTKSSRIWLEIFYSSISHQDRNSRLLENSP